jgi:hypothetical protein
MSFYLYIPLNHHFSWIENHSLTKFSLQAALYNDKMDEVDVPDHAVGRIAKFKEEPQPIMILLEQWGVNPIGPMIYLDIGLYNAVSMHET